MLHGNVPRYDPVTHGPHPDAVLHGKLSKFSGKSLCDVLDSQKACEYMTEHFHASNLSYSSQALPVNTLLDTLMRPNADTEIGVELKSRLGWDKNPAKRVDHIVLGSAPESGGQWTEEPISANWDIGTLRCVDDAMLLYLQLFRVSLLTQPDLVTRKCLHSRDTRFQNITNGSIRPSCLN
jgi:hypothetical protein